LRRFLARNIENFSIYIAEVFGNCVLKTWPMADALEPIYNAGSSVDPKAVHGQHRGTIDVGSGNGVRQRLVIAGEKG